MLCFSFMTFKFIGKCILSFFFFLQMKRSKYAGYFDIKGSEAVCLTCEAVLKISRGSTKGLKYHAEKKHNIDFALGKQLQFDENSSEINYEPKYSSNDDFKNYIEEEVVQSHFSMMFSKDLY